MDDAIERDKRREAKVGEKVIRRMYDDYIKAGGPEPTVDLTPFAAPIYNDALPGAIICDLDGCISLFDHHRGPYEGEKCADDDVNPAVQLILEKVRTVDSDVSGLNDIDIIFMSGREDKFRPQTLEFLHKTGLVWHKLYMRQTGDMRKDSIIKRELYETHVKDKFNIVCILDDRDQTVSMWRSLDLPCFQVNWGKF